MAVLASAFFETNLDVAAVESGRRDFDAEATFASLDTAVLDAMVVGRGYGMSVCRVRGGYDRLLGQLRGLENPLVLAGQTPAAMSAVVSARWGIPPPNSHPPRSENTWDLIPRQAQWV